ncbi:AlpA family transcriptional regulator [Paraglaciecola sp. L3A3]|uniref:helix-turn-helix transcriptional regulator n=1 Tax=Paraglaciecola sp. L3A3 TaxID=2686358 RepID=UPI00131CD244|nr:AlpA family phage regulatory protein [Paraglaciecola sp. L3A3]
MHDNSQIQSTLISNYRLLRRQVVQDLTGLSKATLWRLERDGKFPKAVQLTSRTVGYRESEILAWLTAPTEFQLKVA